MANYCTTTHMRTRIDLPNFSVQIEQLAGSGNQTVQDNMLEQFMEEACGLIDAYLTLRYTVPVTTAADNAFLRGIALDLAVAEIYKRGSGSEIPTKLRKNYEEALKRLLEISDGKIGVPGAENAIQNTSIDTESDTPMFREDDLTTYY